MKKILLSALFFISPYMLGMDDGRTIKQHVPSKTTAIFSHKYLLIKSLAQWLEDTPQGSKIYVANNFLTHPAIVDALIKAKQAGSSINLLIDQESLTKSSTIRMCQQNLKNLLAVGIDSTIYNLNQKYLTPYPKNNPNPSKMHMKIAFWKEHKKKHGPAYHIVSSSANISNNAEYYNREQITFIHNNKDLYKDFKSLFKKLQQNQPTFSQISGKNLTRFILPKWKALEVKATEVYNINGQTPTPFMLSSPRYNLVKTVSNLLKQAQKKDSIFIDCYAVNDTWGLKPTLIQATQRGVSVRIITDKNSARDQANDFKELNQKGKVFVVNEPQGNNHHKFILFNNNDIFWVIEGSCNLTYNAPNDVNELIFHKNDYALWKKFFHGYIATKKQAISLGDFLNPPATNDLDNDLFDQFNSLNLN